MVTITACGREGCQALCKSHPLLPALGADNDADAFCIPGFLHNRKPATHECIPAHFLRNSGEQDRVLSPVHGWKGQCRSGERARCRQKESRLLPLAFAAAKLHPSTCPRFGVRPLPSATCRIIPFACRNASICRDQVDMLDGGDKAHGLSFQERECIFQHRDIKINWIWLEDHLCWSSTGSVPEMDEHIGMVQGYRVQDRRRHNRDRR